MNWVRIRNAKPDDIDAIMALEHSSFSPAWSRQDLKRDIEDNILSYYIVAESVAPRGAESSKIRKINVIGYAGIWVVEDECHVMSIAVAPERRNAGIGAMLFMKLMEEAHLRGASRFFLEVRVSNVPAIAMYEKFGFSQIDIRKRYYEDNNEDAAIMYKRD